MFAELAIHLAGSAIFDFSKAIMGKKAKSEMMQTVLRHIGVSPRLHDFPDRYVEALVELRAEGKTPQVMAFFREQSIMKAFYNYYYGSPNIRGNESILASGLDHCIEALLVGDNLKAANIDVEAEVQHFWIVFRQKVQESRTIKEVELEQKVHEIDERIISIDEKVSLLTDWIHQNKKETIEISGKIHSVSEDDLKAIISKYLSNFGKIPHNLTLPPFQPEVFIGRDDDLEAIHDKLFSGENLLLLVNGEGGIGKTTLASKYYHKYSEEYSHVAWILSEKSITNALLLLGIPMNIQFDDTMPNVDRLKILLKAMADLKKPCLLVIDNANDVNDLEINYQGLRCLSNFHLLITSRITNFETASQYLIDCLSEPDAIKLFRKYYPNVQSDEEDLFNQIHTAIGGNTLVIELLAKNLVRINKLKNKYSLADLLADLQQKGFLKLSQSQEVIIDYHTQGTMVHAKPEDIIAAMYDLDELPQEEVALLSIFAVLPTESISFEMLEKLLPDADNLESPLLNLAQKGWIGYDEDVMMFKISPVVQEVTRKKNLKLRNDCQALIDSLIEKLDCSGVHITGSEYLEAINFSRFAEIVVERFTFPDFDLCLLYERIGIYHLITGNLIKALEIFIMLNKMSYILCNDQPNDPECKNWIAVSNERLGDTHTSMGNLEKALTFYEEHNRLKKELYEAFPQIVEFKDKLAISYQRLGDTHKSLGNLLLAMTFYEEDNRLEKELVDTYPQNVIFKNNLAISYQHIGITYTSMGNLEKALTFYEEHNRLKKELYNASPQNVEFKYGLALSYEILGSLQTSLGNLKAALILYEQYNRLVKDLNDASPQNVIFKNNLAISYQDIGITHASLGNLGKALIFYEEYNRLEKELYDASPQNVEFKNGLAISLQHLGITHASLGNLERALTFHEEYNRLEKELYDAFPQIVDIKNNLAISYQAIGITHASLGNLGKALIFYEEYNRLEKELYNTSPQNVDFKNGLANSLQYLGIAHTSLGNLERALTFHEECNRLVQELYDTSPQNVEFKNGLAISLQHLGITHASLGNLERALPFHEEYNRLVKELYDASPQNVDFKNGLAISYHFLGITHASLGSMGKALTSFKEYNRLRKELYDTYPQNVIFKNGLADSYFTLAQFYQDQKKEKVKAQVYFLRVELLLMELVNEYPSNADYQNNLYIVRKCLDELKGGLQK